VQVSSGKATLKVDAALVPRVERVLAEAGLKPDFVRFEGASVKARFDDLDSQRKAKDALSKALNPDPEDTRATSWR
jgi:preprotein translocase subunit SecD